MNTVHVNISYQINIEQNVFWYHHEKVNTKIKEDKSSSTNTNEMKKLCFFVVEKAEKGYDGS